jgi:hypothetical protein
VNFSPGDFAEDTDFERFVLDRLGTHRPRPPEPGSTHDLRGQRPSISIQLGTVVSGEERRQELLRSLRPLGFGAAFKVLDMLIEHVLRANGASARHLRFSDKRDALTARPAQLPVPLDGRPDLWDRLAAVYVAFEEARHAVTHRRAQVTETGDLEVYESGRLSDTVTSDEMQAFAGAVHAAAELVIDGTDDTRRAGIVAWCLNELQTRHGLAALAADNPNADRRQLIMDLQVLDHGRLRFDFATAHAAVAGQTPSVWDLRLHADDRVFVGFWEEIPDGTPDTLDFHPASPPAWLSEQLAST